MLWIFFAFYPLWITAQPIHPPTPDKIYGQLFIDVQLQQIFPDGKIFVDCTPKRKVADIMYDYGMIKGPGMNLAKFVADNFNLPPAPPPLQYIQQEKDAAIHISNLWPVLKRKADTPPALESKTVHGLSLLPLPYPYVVPGGRFRETYYWDSYFTMLGLAVSGEVELMENMVKNFDYLIATYGHVPNGNRSYYLSRSQPPFFCMMVELLAGVKGKPVYKKYLASMQKEYAYWMEGTALVKKGVGFKRVVKLADGSTLNRYYDEERIPRQESYKEDIETGEVAAQDLAMLIRVASPEKLKAILDNKRADTYAAIRAGASSGWDFSSRWLSDTAKLSTIQTTSIVPVDLNCLMYSMENIIAKALKLSGKTKQANFFIQKATKRKAAIFKYCWNKSKGFFFDYNFTAAQQSENITAAGIFPLFVKMATPAQAAVVAKTITVFLLKEGGIVTSTVHSGQQWDAPNGWAPLQWAAVTGFKNYGNQALAITIARRWLALNDKVYAATGKMMEKYNVEDPGKEAGGGEYPSQDGFGWTNGVYLALLKGYGKK